MAQRVANLNHMEAKVEKEDTGQLLVYIVGGGSSEERIFNSHPDYKVCRKLEDAAIVVWTGGADIDPALYNQKRLSCSTFWPSRDEKEVAAYVACNPDQYKVGICRGGQLLTALNGQPLFQHIDRHAGTHHKAQFYLRGKNEWVTTEINSVHHQIANAVPIDGICHIIGHAHQSTYRVDDKGTYMGSPHTDQEALFFPKTKSFCFQAHPEYGHKGTTDIFFSLLEDVIFNYDDAKPKTTVGKES